MRFQQLQSLGLLILQTVSFIHHYIEEGHLLQDFS
jgi:hypothetical protein